MKQTPQYYPHICNVLKGFHKTIYGLEYKQAISTKLFKQTRLHLRQVLISNQHIANTLTQLMRVEYTDHFFYNIYPNGIFGSRGAYWQTLDHIILAHGDRILDEINSINMQNNYTNPTTKKEIDEKLLNYTNRELLDLRTPYMNILGLDHKNHEYYHQTCEHGYFVGSLLNVVFNYYEDKFPTVKWCSPDWSILFPRADSLIYELERAMHTKHLENPKEHDNINLTVYNPKTDQKKEDIRKRSGSPKTIITPEGKIISIRR